MELPLDTRGTIPLLFQVDRYYQYYVSLLRNASFLYSISVLRIFNNTNMINHKPMAHLPQRSRLDQRPLDDVTGEIVHWPRSSSIVTHFISNSSNQSTPSISPSSFR